MAGLYGNSRGARPDLAATAYERSIAEDAQQSESFIFLGRLLISRDAAYWGVPLMRQGLAAARHYSHIDRDTFWQLLAQAVRDLAQLPVQIPILPTAADYEAVNLPYPAQESTPSMPRVTKNADAYRPIADWLLDGLSALPSKRRKSDATNPVLVAAAANTRTLWRLG